MKAKLIFKLPEESKEFELACKAGDIAKVLFEFDQYLRNEIKYKDKNEFQEIRDNFWKIIDENGVGGDLF